MSDDLEKTEDIKSSESVGQIEQADKKDKLLEQLSNWVNERTRPAEKNARENIKRAILVDLSTATDPQKRAHLEKYKNWVEDSSQNTKQKLNKLYESLKSGQCSPSIIKSKLQNIGDIMIGLQEVPGRGEQVIRVDPIKPNIDSETGEPFLTRVIREQNSWVAEEIRPDGKFISQVRLFDDNRPPELSLFFNGSHYQERNAEVKISPSDSQRYPTGAKVAFNYLAGSLGQVEWGGLIHQTRQLIKGGLNTIVNRVKPK